MQVDPVLDGVLGLHDVHEVPFVHVKQPNMHEAQSTFVSIKINKKLIKNYEKLLNFYLFL